MEFLLFSQQPGSMTTLSWNYHGLGNPLTVRTLRDLVNRFKPTFIFLMEVKIGRSKVERVKHQLQYEGLFVVEGINSGRFGITVEGERLGKVN